MTPDLMVLLSGSALDAMKVECNLANLIVQRTQSTAGGKYLFVWLKFGPGMKSGTAVWRRVMLATVSIAGRSPHHSTHCNASKSPNTASWSSLRSAPYFW